MPPELSAASRYFHVGAGSCCGEGASCVARFQAEISALLRRSQHPYTLSNVSLTARHGLEAQGGPPVSGWPAARLARSRGDGKDT